MNPILFCIISFIVMTLPLKESLALTSNYLDLTVTELKMDTTEYKLSKHAQERLVEFKELAEHGQVLQALVGAAPFLSLIGSGPIDGLFTVANTDWDRWSKVTSGMENVIKNKLRDFCITESISSLNTPEDKRFWREMVKRF